MVALRGGLASTTGVLRTLAARVSLAGLPLLIVFPGGKMVRLLVVVVAVVVVVVAVAVAKLV